MSHKTSQKHRQCPLLGAPKPFKRGRVSTQRLFFSPYINMDKINKAKKDKLI